MDIQYNKLNPSYTFDNFIVGQCNNMAVKAARTVAEGPCREHNPLYLYGASGTGKTHLFHAMGNAALAKNFKIACISCETITRTLVAEICENGNTNNIINNFKDIDFLMLEDLQHLHLKERTQEEVSWVLESLVRRGKQIVLSSDGPPRRLPNLRVNTLEKAYTVEIGTPDMETSLAFMKSRIREKKVAISEELLYFIESQGNYNFFQLEGILNRIVALSHLSSIPIDFELARSVLRAFKGNIQLGPDGS